MTTLNVIAVIKHDLLVCQFDSSLPGRLLNHRHAFIASLSEILFISVPVLKCAGHGSRRPPKRLEQHQTIRQRQTKMSGLLNTWRMQSTEIATREEKTWCNSNNFRAAVRFGPRPPVLLALLHFAPPFHWAIIEPLFKCCVLRLCSAHATIDETTTQMLRIRQKPTSTFKHPSN